MKRAQLMIAVISMTLLGCPSVHTMRGAEVLPSGTSEVVTHVGMNGILIAASAEAEGESDSTAGQGVLPWAAFSYRAGLGNNMDFQVKTDLGLFPEPGSPISSSVRRAAVSPRSPLTWVLSILAQAQATARGASFISADPARRSAAGREQGDGQGRLYVDQRIGRGFIDRKQLPASGRQRARQARRHDAHA